MTFTATYSPDDNKLRLYASGRLPPELYARVREAGFRWAPKQDLFVAPMWTPERENLLVELAGEVGDEDTSLTQRAEERAERFGGYQEHRAADAESAHKAVAAIADNIPLGQPILIGHHSEKHARKDAERIENGMRRAVKMWETSKYWQDRAAGALAHAKYKERPDVRARRIKGLEADLRKMQKSDAEGEKFARAWVKVAAETDAEKQLVMALAVANYCHFSRCFPLADYPRDPPASQYEGQMGLWSALHGGVINAAQACGLYAQAHGRASAYRARWIAHYENRLAYERAMLDEAGGGAEDRWQFAVGGQILRRGQWLYISKVNAASVSVIGHWASTCPFDEIKDYRPPTEEQAAAVTKATKTPPLCNYPGEEFKHLTSAELAARPERKWSDFPKTGVIPATATRAAHRVQRCRGEGQWSQVSVYVTDKKRTDPPALNPNETRPSLKPQAAEPRRAPQTAESNQDGAKFEALKDTLRAGVQVVSAPQLFPTPRELAQRMADMLDVQAGDRVLEPSAGTGALLGALGGRMFGHTPERGAVVAVEINAQLAQRLTHQFPMATVVNSDFLDMAGCTEEAKFDRILMNPPFINGADIKHIQHAAKMLRPGGRLVALCANGPRQREALQPIAAEWEDLPPGSFSESGTEVNVTLLVIESRPEFELTP